MTLRNKGKPASVPTLKSAQRPSTAREDQARLQALVSRRASHGAKVGGDIVPQGEGKILHTEKEIISKDSRIRMRVLVPNNFDGNVDVYFTGQGGTPNSDSEKYGLINKWKEKIKDGSYKGALVLSDGNPKLGVKRKYSPLVNPRKFGDALASVKKLIGKDITSLNMIGFSWGGNGCDGFLNYLKNKSDLSSYKLTYFDANYINKVSKIVSFVKRGGNLEIVFGETSGRVQKHVKEIIRQLKLTQAGNEWTGFEGRVKIVFHPGKKQHEKIIKKYFKDSLGALMSKSPLKIHSADYEEKDYSTAVTSVENKPGVISEKYNQRIKENLKYKKDDHKKLSGTSIKDLRRNPYLLLKKGSTKVKRIENRRIEQARRISVFTEPAENGFRKLNYSNVKDEFLMTIGLGDIYLEAKRLLVVKTDGTRIVCKRGKVESGRQKGRIGFIDEKTNEYVATLDGDLVMQLDDEEVDVANTQKVDDYIKVLDREDSDREAFAKLDVGADYYSRSYSIPHVSGSAEAISSTPSVDTALGRALMKEHVYMARNHPEKFNSSEMCERNAIALWKRIMKNNGRVRVSKKNLRSQPLFAATTALRGKKVSHLKQSDFAKPGDNSSNGKIPIGAAVFVAMGTYMTQEYLEGEGRKKHTPCKEDQRHWFTYAGRDSRGNVILLDNGKKNGGVKSLRDMIGSVGNRKVHNIVDPYAGYRELMMANRDGKLIIDKKRKDEEFASETTQLPIKVKDHFGRVAYLRPDVAATMKRAMKIAEGKDPKMLIRIVAGYRDLQHQERLRRDGDAAGTSVVNGETKIAKKLISKHHTGGAVDVECYVASEIMPGGKTKYEKDQTKIKDIMVKAGFVANRVRNEVWHFEMGTTRANLVAKSKKAGYKKIRKMPGVSTDKLNKGPADGKKFYII